MHTKLHTENKCFGKGRAAKRPLRLHAPRTAILAGTKVSVRRKCEKRQLKINYPTSGNYSQFTYDANSSCVKIVETTSGSVTSTKQFVWSGFTNSESRDGSGNVTSMYLAAGATYGGSNYFYARNHLGSVTEMTNAAGVVSSESSYDAYGRITSQNGSPLAEPRRGRLTPNYLRHL